MTASNLARLTFCLLLPLLWLACTKTPPSDAKPTAKPEAPSTESSTRNPTLDAILQTLAKGLESSKFQRELYHKVLRQTPRTPDLKQEITG